MLLSLLLKQFRGGVLSSMKKFSIPFLNIVRKNNEMLYLKKIRRKNHNLNPTIISNNCIGGVIYHNLGLRFLSPTVNLFVKSDDYLTFCKNLKYYSSCDIVQVDDIDRDYPVGRIVPLDHNHKEITIFFQHYKSFDDARKKWIERYHRINWNNIFYIYEFYDTIYDNQLLYDFDQADLPGKKILLLHREIPNVKNIFVLSCYKEDLPTAKVFEYKGISGRRYLDEFDYVDFLNT